MSIIVAERLRGGPEQVLNPRSRTLGYGPNRATISALKADTSQRGRLVSTRLDGLGSVDVPDWAWWLGGGLVVGAAVGGLAFYLKRKRR